MRVTEIIRGILDIIDQIETQQPDDSVEERGYEEKDAKRFQQIADVVDDGEPTQYENTPNEEYADVSAVTHDAGADGWQGTKEPEDIRGTTTRIYGDN